ncbi:hypothetical protein SPFM8_00064 [Salmonella phage SPFM8]|nr:hypothetical protein SPFM8_00064 [Salmonella phage SPFM8]
MAGPAKDDSQVTEWAEMHFEVWHKREIEIDERNRNRFKGISNINPPIVVGKILNVTTRADGQRVLTSRIEPEIYTTPTKKNTDGRCTRTAKR